jgi:ABC-type multidrug transport system fused ATPase/permease subunit
MEQIARSALPKLVRYVPQEALLLDDTVAANIRFFRDLDDEAVRRAAKRARIHDEIEAMAHGYQTQVGDRGGALSGGQRQRICIARSLVEPAPVLVMDEPTSALDVQSEARVHETLSSLIGTGIVFVVAHRLTTIAMCDRLLVLEGGRVTDYGPAAEVAARNAWFSSVLATGAAAAGASPGAG